jgi:phosphatidylserine synthase
MEGRNDMERNTLDTVEIFEQSILSAEEDQFDRRIKKTIGAQTDRQWTHGETARNFRPSMFSFFLDLPNCVSLAGLACALTGIFCAILGYFQLAVIGILWAIYFDWLDGIVARKTRGRTENEKNFGNQIDSIIDMVSFGVFPAVFLMSYANFSLIFLPGALLIVSVAAVRLSYFTIFGLADPKHYMGLSLDNNMLVLSFLFLFERFVPRGAFSFILYGTLVALLVLNVAPVKTPKFSGKSVYALFGYVIALTIVYALDFFAISG